MEDEYQYSEVFNTRLNDPVNQGSIKSTVKNNLREFAKDNGVYDLYPVSSLYDYLKGSKTPAHIKKINDKLGRQTVDRDPDTWETSTYGDDGKTVVGTTKHRVFRNENGDVVGYNTEDFGVDNDGRSVSKGITSQDVNTWNKQFLGGFHPNLKWNADGGFWYDSKTRKAYYDDKLDTKKKIDKVVEGKKAKNNL